MTTSTPTPDAEAGHLRVRADGDLYRVFSDDLDPTGRPIAVVPAGFHNDGRSLAQCVADAVAAYEAAQPAVDPFAITVSRDYEPGTPASLQAAVDQVVTALGEYIADVGEATLEVHTGYRSDRSTGTPVLRPQVTGRWRRTHEPLGGTE